LHEDPWVILQAPSVERELDRSCRVDRTLRPFADEEVFPSDKSLGPYEVYRWSEERERACATTRPSFVEPQGGWVIAKPFHLVQRGLIDIYQARPPHLTSVLQNRRSAAPVLNVPAVIHLRDHAEMNYGHFLTDLVGGRLRLAAECCLDDLPILVSRRLFESRIFRDFLRLSTLADREFIIQDRQLVHSDQIWLFDTAHYAADSIRYLDKCLPISDSDPRSCRRLFVAREPHRTGRAFINMADVSDLCRRFGFELVYTDRMSLEQQMELFSGASVVVGAHGSAFSNILFRKNATLTLVEIFAPGADPKWLPPWWFFLASVLGHRYEFMYSGPADDGRPTQSRDFVLDTEALARKLEGILEGAN